MDDKDLQLQFVGYEGYNIIELYINTATFNWELWFWKEDAVTGRRKYTENTRICGNKSTHIRYFLNTITQICPMEVCDDIVPIVQVLLNKAINREKEHDLEERFFKVDSITGVSLCTLWETSTQLVWVKALRLFLSPEELEIHEKNNSV